MDTPSLIIRYGIGVIAIIMAMLLFLTWWIKYPDVIMTRITITASQPPTKVSCKTYGELVLEVKDNQQVSINEQLGYIQSPANISDIKKLKHELAQFTGDIFVESNYQLGELQGAYVQFIQAYKEKIWYEQSANINISKNLISKKISQNKMMQTTLTHRQKIVSEQNKIIEERFKNEADLVAQNYLSAKDIQETQQLQNQKHYELESEKVQLLQHQIEETGLYYDRLELSRRHQQDLHLKHNELKRTYTELVSQLQEWEKNNILKSPIPGKVSLFQIWSNYQTVQPGQEVLSILPKNIQCLGKAYVKGVRIGKVKVGQRVVVKLDAYPFSEYGSLTGIITNISKMARENVFVIDISFPKGWITTSKKSIYVVQGMEGGGEIVTKDLRLIQRFFFNLYGLL